jgi:hypothetical protein
VVRANEAYAYFTITGTFDPAEITRAIGVAPTEGWRVGDQRGVSGRERAFSRWSLYSTLPHSEAFEDHVDDVLDQLDARHDAFVALSRERGGLLQLVAHWHEGYPGLSLTSRALKRIGEYALSMDLDMYFLYSDRREDTD